MLRITLESMSLESVALESMAPESMAPDIVRFTCLTLKWILSTAFAGSISMSEIAKVNYCA